MGMRTASPWWASLTFGIGLLFMFAGERLFGHNPGVRMVMTGLGLLTVLGVTGLRAYTTMATSGARRNVERTLLVCQSGVLFSLVLYAFTTKWGMGHFHLSDKGAAKFETVMTVLWSITMLVSLIPMFMIEMSLGTAMRTGIELQAGNDEGIEYMRVRDIGWSGLSVGLAAALLMVTCNVANDRNIQRDVSYFKTSSPGESTKKIVAAQDDTLRVLLFFPPSNEVAAQVRDYFSALASASGHLAIEEHDRLGDAELAGKYKVSKDGVVVLVKGTGDKEKSQNIDLETDIEKARKGASKLRNFDREVNSVLLKLVREKRKAYVMSGHGEISDYDSVPPDLKGRVRERRTSVFKKRLAELNYEVKDLGLIDLAKDVPDDATIVIMLGPTIPLQEAEWAALERYLDKGGRIMIALDPEGEPSMGSFEGKIGLKYNPAPLTDDQAFLPQGHGPADRRFAITTQFSAHASTTSLSRSVDKGLVLIESGALEDAPYSSTKNQPKKTITIRSMESSFLDLNNNFSFDPATEKRQRWQIGAAIEGPKMKGADGKDKDGWRVLVFADADLFADALVQSALGRAAVVLVSGPLLDDSVKWLGGEEVFAGEVVSEDDKPIQHTKNQDAVWFTLTIVGMPLLVLALGLVGTLTRRRRSKTTAEVKS
jgi:gliding motility-associatede transport system auxiliary component